MSFLASDRQRRVCSHSWTTGKETKFRFDLARAQIDSEEKRAHTIICSAGMAGNPNRRLTENARHLDNNNNDQPSLEDPYPLIDAEALCLLMYDAKEGSAFDHAGTIVKSMDLGAGRRARALLTGFKNAG